MWITSLLLRLEASVGLHAPEDFMTQPVYYVCAVNPMHAINLYHASNQLVAKSSNSNVVGSQIVKWIVMWTL